MVQDSHPRLTSMWRDNPTNPGRMSIDHPRVLHLVDTIAPGSAMSDLGGTFSLNVRLEPAGIVLRIHQPFVSRRRLLALQALRAALVRRGLVVAPAIAREGATVLRCGDRWAELEPFVASDEPHASPEAFAWLFSAVGRLNREMESLDPRAPTPLVSTYAVPSTLLRWLPIAERAFAGDEEALDALARVRFLVGRLRPRWTAARRLPRQWIHGDAKFDNIRCADGGEPVYLDFGFAAERPRIHELAYAIAWMILALGGHDDPASFAWDLVPTLLDPYEDASGSTLSTVERRALAPYVAAVPLYHAITAGFLLRPMPALRSALPFVVLSEWLFDHPDVITG